MLPFETVDIKENGVLKRNLAPTCLRHRWNLFIAIRLVGLSMFGSHGQTLQNTERNTTCPTMTSAQMYALVFMKAICNNEL